jgi:hypothetical protein
MKLIDRQKALATLDASLTHLANYHRLVKGAKTDTERRAYAATGYDHAVRAANAFFALAEIVEPRKK